jgi:3-methyladenine DNA glycosylase AlkD
VARDAYVDDLLDALTTTFAAAADRRRAPAMRAYMRDRFPFLGIPTPQRRTLSRAVLAGRPRPTERQLAGVLRRCWALAEREYQYFASDVANRNAAHCSGAFLGELRRCVTHKSWWDTVDALAYAVGTLVLAHPTLVADMDRWVDDDDMWVARVAILHQLRYKERTDAARLFDYCTRRAAHPDFFVRKAIGWALREYSKTDADAVRHYVADMGAALSPLSRREALRRIPVST